MKKTILLIPTVTFLSGCSAMLGSDGIGAGYEPGATTMTPTHYEGKPRPYSVTPQDQVKYNELTKKIQDRQHAMSNSPAVPPSNQSGDQATTS